MFFTLFLLLSTVTGSPGGNSDKCRFSGWEIQPQCGDIPPISAASHLISSRKDLYLILGFNECFNVDTTNANKSCENEFYPYDTIYKYDTKFNEWEEILTGPDPVEGYPPARAFAGIDITEDEGDIIVYGGAFYDNTFNTIFTGGPSTFYNDFWKYSIDDNQWTKIQPTNPDNDPNAPGFLSLVGLVANKKEVYVFGGFSFFDPNAAGENDLFKYTFATNTWTKIAPSSASAPVPPGRGIYCTNTEPLHIHPFIYTFYRYIYYTYSNCIYTTPIPSMPQRVFSVFLTRSGMVQPVHDSK